MEGLRRIPAGTEFDHARTQHISPMPPIMEPGEFYMPYPVEVTFGGATVFVLDVARYERL